MLGRRVGQWLMRLYLRLLIQHVPAVVRAALVLVAGLVVTLALLAVVPWQVAVITGWDAAAMTFVVSVWRLVRRSDGPTTMRLASREDDTHPLGSVLLLAACTASLLGVGFALRLAGEKTGSLKALLIALAVATVTLSWTMLNSIFILRYAHLYYGLEPRAIDFAGTDDEHPPAYRDFAYLAFTVGMTYQVSDTPLNHSLMRRTVLTHAVVAFGFGVVIVAGAINLIADLLR